MALKERTWQWVAERLAMAVVGEALADPAMRAALTPAEVVGDPGAVVKEMRAYLVGSLLNLDLESVVASVRRAALLR